MSTLQSASPSGSIQPAKSDDAKIFPTPAQFFILLLCYFSAHLLTRTLISEVAGIDEGDQLVAGQKWSWGYGLQPPLYTWLLMIFTRVFGPSIFSLTLLRESMLFGIYALTYLNARELTRSHVGGLAAATALQFSPSIVWESQRELTHSILASLMILATLFAFLKLRPDRASEKLPDAVAADVRRRKDAQFFPNNPPPHVGGYDLRTLSQAWTPYLAFGICGGSSILSKYNAALFYVGILVAGLSLPRLRGRILDRRMAVALGLSVLLILPNIWWVWHHRSLAFASLYKFGVHEAAPWMLAVRTGLLHWFGSAGAHIAPMLLVFAALFWRPSAARISARFHSDEERALWRTLLFMCGIAILSVLCVKVTNFKDRWLQPVFVSLPILLVAVWRDSLDRTRLRAMLWLGASIGVVVLLLAPGRVLLTERLNKREILNAPFRQLAPDLAPLIERADFVVSSDRWLAGNLRLWFPHKLVISPDLMEFYNPAGRRCLLIWEVNPRTASTRPPPPLIDFAHSFSGEKSEGEPVYVEEVWKYHKSRRIRLGALMVKLNPATPNPDAGRFVPFAM